MRAMPREDQLNPLQASYIAGFLDGDGSIHFQFVRQKEYRFGFYIRASLSLSQCTSSRHLLVHLQQVLGGGYVRDRGTGMSDLVITSRPLLYEILCRIEPYVLFKREQVQEALRLLPRIRPRMELEDFLDVVKDVDGFSSLNHSKTKQITAADVEQHLRDRGLLVPVSTSLVAHQGDGSSA